MSYSLTQEIAMAMEGRRQRVIDEMRAEGYALVIITPEELKDASADKVEDRLIELSWDIIEGLN